MISINCRGRLLQSADPLVMGVINVTPDSFYAGSRFLEFDKVEQQVERMLTQGADIIDIGAMSTRPGAAIIDPKEELQRLLEPIKTIRKRFPEIYISLDTVSGEVAAACLDEGVDIINDISGASIDETLLDVVAKYKVPYILMHMLGTPEIMQRSPKYEDVVIEVLGYLKSRIHTLRQKGITELIVDPGFGFGKSLVHNYQLLKNLSVFKILECPILVGMSRKKMVQTVIGQDANNALNGTTAVNLLSLMNGANILRVHDVKEAVETVAVYKQYNDS